MDHDLDAVVIRYQRLFEQLTDESVDEFREFASPHVRYRDPMEDAKGVDAAVAYMHTWFRDLDGIQFEMKDSARDGQLVFSHWRMTFRIKRLPKKLWELEGVSKIVFDDAGRVEEQIDYWDVAPLLDSIPVMGGIVTLIKKLIAR